MGYTMHGHHIPGSAKENYEPENRVLCGGTMHCGICKTEVELFRSNTVVEDPMMMIKRFVTEYIDNHPSNQGKRRLPAYEVFIVTYTYILGGWKARAATTLPDGRYFELTLDVHKNEVYFDAYKHEEKVVIRL